VGWLSQKKDQPHTKDKKKKKKKKQKNNTTPSQRGGGGGEEMSGISSDEKELQGEKNRVRMLTL